MDLQDDRQHLKSSPDKWRKVYSRTKPGRYYFHNVKTNATSWTLPEGALLQEFKGSSQSETKAPASKKKPKTNIPAQAKKEYEILQPRATKKSITVLSSRQPNNDTSINLEDPRIFCASTIHKSEDGISSKIQKNELQKFISNEASQRASPNLLPPKREHGFTQVDLKSAPHGIKKKRKKRKKNKSTVSTTINFSQLTSLGTDIKSSEPHIVISDKTVASGETGKYGAVTNHHSTSLSQSSVSAPSLTDTKASEGTLCLEPFKSGEKRDVLMQNNDEKHSTPSIKKLRVQSNQHSALSASSICSSIDVIRSNITSDTNEEVFAKDLSDLPQTKFAINEGQRRARPIIGSTLSNSDHNIPSKLETHGVKKVAKNDKHISDKMKTKTPAQARLKRLQKSPSRKYSKEETQTSGFKASKHIQPAAKRLAKLQTELKPDGIYNKMLEDCVIPVEKGVNANPSQSCVPICAPNDLDCMDIEYIESEVLEDITTLRQEDRQDLSHPIMFMEVDINLPLSHPDTLYVVLDTNVLLSHLQFVESLRDTILPENVFIHLYLPWQVLQELDHLKNKGKTRIQPLARAAIRFLHANFSCKHPRVCGQKLNEATQSESNCPDDSILLSCIKLKEEGYSVVLLSNDTNLLNKALVCDVKAFTKDQFVEQYTNNSYARSDCFSHSVQDENLQTSSTSSSDMRDVVLCEMKTLVKDTLSLVVSKGMEDEYGHLWTKRTLISPPWEIDDVLRCLGHHWLSICDNFLPESVAGIISKLRDLMKKVSKGCGGSILELTESLDLIISLLQVLPSKYRNLVQGAIENSKVLKSKLDKTLPVIEPTQVPTQSNQLLENQSAMVLSCFEQAHSAAQSVCNSEFSCDPDWMPKAQAMLQSVQQLIHLVKVVLSLPYQSLDDKNPEINELTCLIKGASSIASGDLAEFCKLKHNRILLENGMHQFISFASFLSNKLQSSLI